MKILLGATAAAVFAFTGVAQAGTADLLYVDETYTSTAQSIILQQAGSSNFFLEDFEDGQLNSPYLNASNGFVRTPGANTDSVDTDDSALPDGLGLAGHSWKVSPVNGQPASVTFSFDSRGGSDPLPTWVGAVVTDLREGLQDITIEAFDADGISLGAQTITMDGDPTQGTTGEDRFIGMSWVGGISAFTISTAAGSLELDHVQYAYAASVIPLPAPLAMGLAGLAGIGVVGRRRRIE